MSSSTINPYSLLNTSTPSLANYLANNQNATTAQKLGFQSYGTSADGSSSGAGSDTLSLSPQAQAMLDKAKGSSTSASSSSDDKTLNQAQTNAQGFIASFFDDNGIDISKVSSDTMSLFQGLSEMINDMSSPTTNASLDGSMSKASHGARQSTTLQEDGHTLSFVINYSAGKPSTMTVTDVNGSSASTAVISFTKDAQGKQTGLNVTNQENTYNQFGGKTSSVKHDTLNFALYAADSTTATDA